jgi:serine/threonine protein kinase
MRDNPPLTQFKGGIGKWYKAPRKIESSDTPDYTPSVTYSCARYKRPEIWQATRSFSKSDRTTLSEAFLQHSGQMVAIKSSKLSDGYFALKAEADALNRLQWLSWFPPFRIAPRLYENLKYDEQESNRWFIAYEWLRNDKDVEEGVVWENLSTILKTRTLETTELIDLLKSLYRTVRLMHRMGVYHGDLKDEHVLIKVEHRLNKSKWGNEKIIKFTSIRLIDFGLSYMSHVDEWKGASPGFCSPYFWNSNNNLLDKNSLNALDWYCVDALLYYATTGECFPIASPAYSELSGDKNKAYFSDIQTKLINAHSKNPETARNIIVCWLIKRLSAPDPTGIRTRDKILQRQITSLSGRRNTAYWYLGLLLGTGVFSLLFKWNSWLSTIILTIVLIGIRVLKNTDFSILDWGTNKQPEIRSTPNWVQFVPPLILGLIGTMTLPIPVLSSIPICIAMFVKRMKYSWISAIAVVIGSFLAWTRLSISSENFSAINNWASALQIGPPALYTIIISWLIAYIVIVRRHLVKNYKSRWYMVVLATLFVWLFPLLVGQVLFSIPLKNSISIPFMFSGFSSLLLSLVTALFATWEVLINVFDED